MPDFSGFCRYVLRDRVDEVLTSPPYLRFADPAYGARLLHEVGEVDRAGFWGQLEFAAEVVRLAEEPPRVPHICRGSAGSSLLCYLVGISSIDPVREGIAFTRFLGGRDTPPDVDLDFPAHLRGEVWRRVRSRYGDRVGFLATGLRYREKGALREALRRLGVPLALWVSGQAVISEETRGRVLSLAGRLEGKRFAVARHCGGLVFFSGGVPGGVRLARGADPFVQTSLEKGDVTDSGKVDVLSNRGLGHLSLCGVSDPGIFSGEEEGAGRLFSVGDTWGIVQGESPAMRKVFLALGARTRGAVVLALGLVRPAAGGGKQGAVGRNPLDRLLVYEDDVAELLGVALGCSASGAEYARRALVRGDGEADAILSRVESCVGRRGRMVFRGRELTVTEVRRQLGMAKAFAFCKAHATAYGYVVWALGCLKAACPEVFWEGFVNSGALASSLYLPWVHFERVKSALGVRVVWPGDLGLSPSRFYRVPWRCSRGVFGPGVVGSRLSGALGVDSSSWVRQLQVAGFWEGESGPLPGTWFLEEGGRGRFRGLSALKSPRLHPLGDGRLCLFATLGYGSGQVIEWGRVVAEGAPLPPASLFERGEGVISGRIPGGVRVR